MGNNICNVSNASNASNASNDHRAANNQNAWMTLFLAEMKKLNISMTEIQKWLNGSSKPSTSEQQRLYDCIYLYQQQLQSQMQSNQSQSKSSANNPQNNQFMFGHNSDDTNTNSHQHIQHIQHKIKSEHTDYHTPFDTVNIVNTVNNIECTFDNIDVTAVKQEIKKEINRISCRHCPFPNNINNKNNGNNTNINNDVNILQHEIAIPCLEREASDATDITTTTISTSTQSPNYLNLNVMSTMNGMIAPISPITPPMYNINDYSSPSIQITDTQMKDLTLPHKSKRSISKHTTIDISNLPQIPLNDPTSNSNSDSIYTVPPLVPSIPDKPPKPDDDDDDDNDINMNSVSYFDITMNHNKGNTPSSNSNSNSITGHVNNAIQPPSTTNTYSVGLAPTINTNQLITQQYQPINIMDPSIVNASIPFTLIASNPLDFSKMPVIDIFASKGNSEETEEQTETTQVPSKIKADSPSFSFGVKFYNKSKQRGFKNCRKLKMQRKVSIDIEEELKLRTKPKLVQARAGCDKIFERTRKSKQNKRSRSSSNKGVLSTSKYPLGGGGIMKGNKLKEMQEKDRKLGIEIIDEKMEEGPIQIVKCNESEALCDRFYFCVVTITRIIQRAGYPGTQCQISRKYKCLTDNCDHGHLYAQKCHFVRHARTDHAKLRFECEHCGKQFRQSTQKNEHLKAKHGRLVNKWQCPYGCTQHFAQLRGVWRHVNADRKCDARSRYFGENEVELLKKHWSNPEMSKLLKFSTQSDIPKSGVVTIQMQHEMRKKVKAMIQEFSSKYDNNNP